MLRTAFGSTLPMFSFVKQSLLSRCVLFKSVNMSIEHNGNGHHVNGLNGTSHGENLLKVNQEDVGNLVALIRKNNNYLSTAPHRDAVPFYAAGKLVGLIKDTFLPFLLQFPDVFDIEKAKAYNGYPERVTRISLSDRFDSCEARTSALRIVVNELRQHSSVLVALKGWRDEDYSAYYHFHDGPVFMMERAATCVFGIRRYGVHINGFVRNPETGIVEKMWLGQRALDKPTYPGLLDNMAAGGLTSGYSIVDVAKKELQEEASVPESVSRHLKPAGVLSYCYEDERGICPESLFIYDLELPPSFRPLNGDGEVDGFALKTIPEVFKLIQQPNFKPNSALVIFDFLIRHGFITPEHTPYYSYFVSNMHVDPFIHYAPLVQCPPLV